MKVYRAMQVIDGKLYPPMSARVEGKLREPEELGTWGEAEERPDLVRNGKFTLRKGKGADGKDLGSVPAAYNPYFHASRSPLNDQFKSAWDRPNLVTVECEIPESELTSGYKAEGAKDSVGETAWPAGAVGKELAKLGRPRKVVLSRWLKPVRILDDKEVAAMVADQLKGTDIVVPENTVTPSLKAALEEAGVKIGAPEKGMERNADGKLEMQKIRDEVAQSGGKGLSLHTNKGKRYYDTITELARQPSAEAGQSSLRLVGGPISVMQRAAALIADDVARSKEEVRAVVLAKWRDEQRREDAGAGITSGGEQTGNVQPVWANEIVEREVSRRIIEWAKHTGCYFHSRDFDERYPVKNKIGEGEEGIVFLSTDGKTVLKLVHSLGLYDTTSAKLDSIAGGNALFGADGESRVIGFMEGGWPDEVVIAIEQPFVKGKTVLAHFGNDESKAQDYINNMMSARGFRKATITTKGWFSGIEVPVYYKGSLIAKDVNAGNVIIDDNGSPHIIDCIVVPNTGQYASEGIPAPVQSHHIRYRKLSGRGRTDFLGRVFGKLPKDIASRVAMANVKNGGDLNKAVLEALKDGKGSEEMWEDIRDLLNEQREKEVIKERLDTTEAKLAVHDMADPSDTPLANMERSAIRFRATEASDKEKREERKDLRRLYRKSRIVLPLAGVKKPRRSGAIGLSSFGRWLPYCGIDVRNLAARAAGGRAISKSLVYAK